jgi:membrane associated rhomboid family serine protease
MSQQPEQAPVCYRHPERETYIRCGRCDRPICPACMTPAAVGFQCPECIKEGSKSVRQARTPFGGAMTAPDKAPITFGLIGINVLAFVLTGSVGSGPQRSSWYDYALFTGHKGFGSDGVANGQYYRLLTGMFLHIGLFHIAFNMYALYAVGPQLEQVLGRWRYTALYFISGLGGSVATYLFAGPNAIEAGASGAIFGLFAAYLIVARKLGANTGAIAATIGINLIFTFSIPGISKTGHLGGLAFGAVLALVFTYVPAGPKRTQLHLAGALALSAALVVLTAIGPT